MAYASLVSLGHLLKHILDQDQPSFPPHQIASLHDHAVSLIHFLDDYPQLAEPSLETRIWAAANHAQDIIEYQVSAKLKSDYAYWGLWSCIKHWILSSQSPPTSPFGENLIHEMKSLEDITKDATTLIKRRKRKTSKMKYPIVVNNSLSSGDKTTDFVGLEHDLLEIKSRLCGELDDNLRIVPITGMGGVGKTTLAKCVYDDRLCLDHFDVRGWATASQDPDADRIVLSQILHSMNLSDDKHIDRMSAKELLEHLYKTLKGRRYLIVMDDLWETAVWDDVRQAFPDDCNGSRIVITSRHLDVASYADPSNTPPHRMDLMDANKSWNLLRKKVFGRKKCPNDLEKFGRFIAEMCRGLPLAIVVVAGILATANKSREVWEDISKNVDEVVKTHDENFTEILSLSYKHLPHHLRPCFLYMGFFPENYEISVSKLVKLWAAEGFIRPHESKHAEDVGRECLEDLISRSLVVVFRKSFNGETKTVKIHDLLRDLCVREARESKFVHITDKFAVGFQDHLYDILDSRRLSGFVFATDNFPIFHDYPTRTILFSLFTREFSVLRCLKLLRILDASTQEFTAFPAEFGELFHLRYLAMAFAPDIKFSVPQTLSKLQYLQTLIILPCDFKFGRVAARYLGPFRIWRLPQLRHLILSNFYLSDLGAGTFSVLENLHNLHILAHVVNFTCSEKVLKMAPNLKKLEICYLPNDLSKTGWSNYMLNKLVDFHVLEKLNLRVELPKGSIPFLNFPYPTLQASGIAFPETLKKLTLSGCGLPWSDMSVVGLLPNLEVLYLKSNALRGYAWETREDEFCQLKVLEIEKADVQEWETESSHFPCLERLILWQCQFLREIPRCIGDIPTLKLIGLVDCSSLVEESALAIEEEQREFGNDELVVRKKRVSGNRLRALRYN